MGGAARFVSLKCAAVKAMKYFFAGCAFWGSGILALYAVRPSSKLAASSVKTVKQWEMLIISVVMIATILLCILPMSLSPIWNGEVPQHRNQYELLSESILDGHIYITYDDIDPKLLQMENPYDPALRKDLGVSYHWDHAFYNGHYYMYFGVVPVFLIFLPFRLITGVALTTYHATQVFTALFIVGVFILFLFLAKKFFCTLSLAVYLSLSSAVSIMSVWYAAEAPALYCTAITSALCLEIWSLFFFVKAVWGSTTDRSAVGYGMVGSLFGALAFGCRPTVALANLLAVPMLINYIKRKKLGLELLRQITITILPYVIIGSLLMIYNYVRFENPFEFGQSYQLTVADQSDYSNALSQFNVIKVVNGLMENFIAFIPLKQTFPYISHSSALINFPICIIAGLFLFRRDTKIFLKENELRAFFIQLACLPVIITIAEILMAPYLRERYRMDIYWLMGLLSYLSFGIFYHTTGTREQKRYGFLLSILAYITILKAFLLWTVPNDSNFTAKFPEYIGKFEKVLFLGLQ